MREQFQPLSALLMSTTWISGNCYFTLKEMIAAKERGEYKGQWKMDSWLLELIKTKDFICCPAAFHAAAKAALKCLEVWTWVKSLKKNPLFARIFAMHQKSINTLKSNICSTGNGIFQFLADREEAIRKMISVWCFRCVHSLFSCFSCLL